MLRKVVPVVAYLALVVGCQGGAASMPDLAASSPGCTKDTDCKGDRICVERACVSPSPAQDAATPHDLRDARDLLGGRDLAMVLDLFVPPDLLPVTRDLKNCVLFWGPLCDTTADCCPSPPPGHEARCFALPGNKVKTCNPCMDLAARCQTNEDCCGQLVCGQNDAGLATCQ